MHIGVVGLGKLGSCIMAVLASKGFKVIGYDLDNNVRKRLKNETEIFLEPKLSYYLRKYRRNINIADDLSQLKNNKITFFILPTPSLEDNSFDNSFLLSAIQELSKIVNGSHIFVINSTTTPGSIDKDILPVVSNIVYNPEFIAMGNVIEGLENPDVFVVGESNKQSGDYYENILKKINNKVPIKRMSIINAELVKVFCNSFSTMKISFTNQLRQIVDQIPGANSKEILSTLSLDKKIGEKCLTLGTTYGGPCLPRDNYNIKYLANKVNKSALLCEATDKINDSTKEYLLEKILKTCSIREMVFVLGVAYKTDTHLTDESFGLYVANSLFNKGFSVFIHDPVATKENNKDLEKFNFVNSLETVQQIAKNVIICLPYEQYLNIKFTPDVNVINFWAN